MDRIKDYQAFIAIVEKGGLTAAAKQLRRSLQSVSRSLAALEREVGVELIRRTTRRSAPTDAGLAFHRRLSVALGEIEAATLETSSRRAEAMGILRAAGSTAFAPLYVVPALPAFLKGTNSVLLHPLHSFAKLVAALKPGGLLAMNTPDFDHWIGWFFPRLMIGWNAMFNPSRRSLDVLMRKVGLTLIHRSLEWQTTTVDHFFRVLRVRAPAALRRGTITVPAVSFPLIIARK
jgi:hypothetical protein